MAGPKHDTILANWKCLLACVLVSMSPFQYGIDFGLIGGIQAMVGFMQIFGYRAPESPVGWNITAEVQQLMGSLMTLGAVVASSLAGPLAKKLGRRMCLWIACIMCCASDIVMMATTNLSGLYAGRLFIGLANGLFMTFSQLYIQECAPAQFRGLLLSAFMFWTSIGTLIGTIVDNATAEMLGRKSYLIPLGIIYLVPLFIALGLFFIPESPRWLMETGKIEQARKSLDWLRPNKDAVEAELRTVQEVIEEAEANSGRTVFLEMFKGTNLRRTVLAVCALNTQAASGAMFVIAYGTYFFEMAGVGRPFENAVILVTVGVLAVIANTFVITRWGRRRVFLFSGLIICGMSQLTIAAVDTAKPHAESTMKAIVGVTVVYIIGYNALISSYAWLSGGELPSQRLRSYTFGLATSTGFLGAWLATFTAPYFINPQALNWGPKYGYIWAPSCAIAAIWVYFFLPEVKGRSLEEIDEMFQQRLQARKFRHYVCTSRAAVESKARNLEMEEQHRKRGAVETIEVVYGDGKAVAAVNETAMNVA